MENSKKCRKCHLNKDKSCFAKNNSYKDHLATICKRCDCDDKKKRRKNLINDNITVETEKFKIMMCELNDFDKLNIDAIEKKCSELCDQIKKIKMLKNENLIILKNIYDEISIKGISQQIFLEENIILDPSQIQIVKDNLNIKVIYPKNIIMTENIKSKIISQIAKNN